jgi:hypothetical protein
MCELDWVQRRVSRDSSVGIALGYELDDRGSRVRFPAGAGNFSLHHRVQTGSVAHPASYPTATRGSFPRGKVAGGAKLTTHLLTHVFSSGMFSLTEHHAMKAYRGEWRYSSTHSLTSALDGGEWSASRPGRFIPRKKAPGTH